MTLGLYPRTAGAYKRLENGSRCRRGTRAALLEEPVIHAFKRAKKTREGNALWHYPRYCNFRYLRQEES
ncbi:MAG TPA: hypothetical protein VKP30_29040 [Polyangiaceae bacterium]|nr:hypothetical protein [Polyangiaceae bacterium]